jgi:hypothetical protein
MEKKSLCLICEPAPGALHSSIRGHFLQERNYEDSYPSFADEKINNNY